MPETLAVKFLWRCFMCRPNLFKWLAGNNAKHSLCQFCLWPNDLKSGRLNISASSWINNKQEDLIQQFKHFIMEGSETEVILVNAVTAGGSVKFLPVV